MKNGTTKKIGLSILAVIVAGIAVVAVLHLRPRRGIGLMTGEEVPVIGESGVARLFVVDLKPDEIPIGPRLTQVQDQASAGLLAQAMRGYIEWLLPQVEGLSERLKALYQRFRIWAQENLSGVHGRQPEAVAWLLVGYRMALDFWAQAGALEDSAALWAHASSVFLDHSQTQSQALQGEQPITLFVEALNELLVMGKARIMPVLGPEGAFYIEQAVGYRDTEYVYLLPGAAYGAVCEHYKAQGTVFPIGKTQLWKRMAYKGIVKSWPDRGQTKTRNIPGRGSVSLIWIPRAEADRLFKF